MNNYYIFKRVSPCIIIVSILFFFEFILFYFILIFKLYIIVLVLPNIKMNPPQVFFIPIIALDLASVLFVIVL